MVVYHGADWLTSLRPERVRVHLDAELGMPFVPGFILAYLSLNFVFVPAPFILRGRRELRALALSLAAVTAVAGIGFLLLPAEVAYPRRDPGPWSALFAVAHDLALRYNLSHQHSPLQVQIADSDIDYLYAATHQFGAEHAPMARLAGKLVVNASTQFEQLQQPTLIIWGARALNDTQRIISDQQLSAQAEMALIPGIQPFGVVRKTA